MHIVFIKLLAGAALLLTPRLLTSETTAVVNSYLSGICILLLAIAGMRWPLVSRYTGILVGIWLVAAPFVLHYRSSQATIATLSIGFFVTLFFALFNGTMKKKARKIPAICIL